MLFRICAVLCNFYPRPPRGGRPVCFAAGRVSVSISIHALREEGDISSAVDAHNSAEFLSTPSARRATGLEEHEHQTHCNFYPRPPRGGRLAKAGIATSFRLFLSTPSARRATLKIRLCLKK